MVVNPIKLDYFLFDAQVCPLSEKEFAHPNLFCMTPKFVLSFNIISVLWFLVVEEV